MPQIIISKWIAHHQKICMLLPCIGWPLLTGVLALTDQLIIRHTLSDNASERKGINLDLSFFSAGKDTMQSKIQYYEAADADSIKEELIQKNDPWYASHNTGSPAVTNTLFSGFASPKDPRSGETARDNAFDRAVDPSVLLTNLSTLNKLKTMVAPPVSSDHHGLSGLAATEHDLYDNTRSSSFGLDQRSSPQPYDTTAAQQLSTLNQMLEQIGSLQQKVAAPPALPVTAPPQQESFSPVTTLSSKEKIAAITLLEQDSALQVGNQPFYGLEQTRHILSNQDNAIIAKVCEKQHLTTNSIVRLQLVTPIRIKDVEIPAGQILFASCVLQAQRWIITVRSIKMNDHFFHVYLTAYDVDGQAGIHLAGSTQQEVIRVSGAQMIDQAAIPVTGFSPAGQTANIGIQAARQLLGHKVRETKLVLPTGYQVFLQEVRP